MQWTQLTELSQLNDIKNAAGYSIIFKHSTRCSVSTMAKKSFEFDWDEIPAGTGLYFLDLLKHRDISSQIAEIFQVHHESPQALLIKQGECILDASHSDISVEEMVSLINS